METKANYVLIGVFTLLVAVAMLLFGLWAAKYSSDRNWQAYHVVFNEPVTGLTEGGAVQYNGISVGTVDSLSLAPQDPRRVVARIRVHADVPVKVDTRAKLSMTGLTGATFIQLTGGSPEAPRLTVRGGEDIPVILTEASALQNIADTANRLVARLDEVLSDENVARIAATLEHIEGMTGAVAGQREDLASLITNARVASEKLVETVETSNRAMSGIDRELVQKLPGMVERLESTLARVDSAANSADAILGENRNAINSFANDGLAQLGPTLSELRSLVRDLRRISDRFDSNPARYLLGRDAPKEFEPE
ncbi:MlaD family protein [Luteimonas arsenica]|uniref:MlaD family protein n=1 Tax=Luteimonas arsenica TaxID=1586242 RepID=UPI001054DC6F|nr:MlaD family protein [Luteimonas arsenica]